MNDGYWRDLHHATADDLAAVNYPGLPPAFNRLLDRIFAAPILDVVKSLSPGLALEVGCGRGRWTRRIRALGWRAHGLDIASDCRPGVVAEAGRLPVSDGVADLAYAITVLQHIDQKAACLDELVRVVKPGGHLLLVELLDRPGVRWQSHVRPCSAAWWREALAQRGLIVEAERPVEYLPILRLIERVRSTRSPGQDAARGAGRSGGMRAITWTAIAWASALLEPVAPFFIQASHRLFLARRPTGPRP